MKKYLRALSLFVLAVSLIILTTPPIFSQVATESDPTTQVSIQTQANSPAQTKTTSPKEQNFPVTLDEERLFSFSSVIEGIPAKNRAEETSKAIEKVAKNFAIDLDSIQILELEGLRLVSERDNTVFAVLEADARVANKPLDKLADEYLATTKDAIARYRIKYSRKRLLLKIGLVIAEAIALILLMILLRKLLNRINRRIEVFKSTLFRPINIQNWQVLSVEQEASIVEGLVKCIYWLAVAAIFFAYLSLLTFHLPQAQPWRKAVFQSLLEFLDNLGQAAIAYLPNLFTILLTIVIAYYIIRFCRFFFGAIRQGHLSIPGFYPEWARPTQRLLVVLIIALTLATIFPLLPGAKSPAFRGISIFAGALFTLGGASTIANLVGGFIIIYTRAFQIGDRVQVGDVIGIILEKTILSTRIRTAKNEIVTIPNANLITTNIKNFSTAYRDINQPIILYTVVTLGYDVPWRNVHRILKEAALLSPSILKDPAPFVLQTSLGDFSVSYELNAYTEQPSMMPNIYSELHQNIQDKCNEAGIEILSPQYSAVRDGNQNTMPENYLPKDYQAPGFRFNPLDRLLNKPHDSNNHQK
ncbi:MAG: mechanosensitive ion channel family protein [Pleurocapsa sp. MO_192.B19]|nr:mechanosensitive ion channel family protein [Pleurocapsa sp. MO_192.B19]